MTKPFRFGAYEVGAGSKAAWVELARRVENSGFSTLQITDHLNPQLAPIPALMAAADATTTLRVGTEVFCNDYRHPLILAMDCATVDLLSDGRLEIGVGAGWMLADYVKSGITMDVPSVRVDRLEEGVHVLKKCLGGEAFSFSGSHYRIEGYAGGPRPVQRPHPPILIGGGSKRMLRLAGREADIVGINFDLRSDAKGTSTSPMFWTSPEVVSTGTHEAVAEKIQWVREGAGARFDELEFNITCFIIVVTDDHLAAAESIGRQAGVPAETILDLPFALIGSVERITDVLIERRERFGFSYITLPMPLVPDGYRVLSPLVERLAGT